MAHAPEVVHIAVTFADGSVGAMQFVVAQWSGANDEAPAWTREPTRENIEEELRKMTERDPETGNIALDPEKLPIKSWRFCAADNYPQDRTYRNAWRDTGSAIVHDMPAAREIHRNILRQYRAPRLDALDVEYQRADERNDQHAKKDVAARKQKLRDAPADPRIAAAQTVEQLKIITLPE
jgi:hypothetical protein